MGKTRVVPEEPTPEMKTAAVKVEIKGINCLTWEEATSVYRAMLAAAPDPFEDAELVELVAVAVERELDIDEAVLADPTTKRRLKARRIARRIITAMKGE